MYYFIPHSHKAEKNSMWNNDRAVVFTSAELSLLLQNTHEKVNDNGANSQADPLSHPWQKSEY